MPGMPPPAADERQTLLEFLAFQQNAFFAVAYGLTDEQARSTPSVSALSIGGLVKHAAGVQRGWAQRAASAPGLPAAGRPPVRGDRGRLRGRVRDARRRNPRRPAGRR